MKPTNGQSYHKARAEEELKRADEAGDPAIAKVHRELAALHRRRMLEIVHLGEPQYNPAPLIGHRQLQADS